MGKLLKIKDYILISASLTGDFLEYTRSGWGVMPFALKNFYGFVPSGRKYNSYLSGVSKMLSTGYIKRVVNERGEVSLELAPKGKEDFRRKFPLYMQDKKWDGFFMLVAFDIKEENRAIRSSLRVKLEQLGFGMLQKSVYISPYHFEEDMREFLETHNLEESVLVLTARKLFLGDLKKFAQKIWSLNKINKKYMDIISLLEKEKKIKNYNGKKSAKKAINLYLSILAKDPMLPDEFLPSDWARERTLKAINHI